MGTNYYWHAKPRCPTCNRCDDPIHIGKSSCGWVFSLHVGHTAYLGEDDEPSINSLEDWKELFARPGSFIEDEYRDVVTVEEMLSTITERQGICGGHLRRGDYKRRPGNGTYDLCEGEFR